MWSSVAVLALPMALDPVRLGINLLLISRPRPAQNLLAYWLGCVTACVALLAVPLLVLHFTPVFSPFVRDLANPGTSASSSVRHGEIFMGVLALLIAAVLAARFLTRQRAQLPSKTGANGSTLVLDPYSVPDSDSDSASDVDAPTPLARLLGGGQDAGTQGGSAIRRLLGRARSAWDNGSLWVAFAIGFWAGPPPSLVIPALTTILASGAAIGVQVSAALVFAVESLAVVEIILVSNMVTPTRTQAVLRLLHDWVQAHRRQILVAIFTVVGVMLVAQGMGGM